MAEKHVGDLIRERRKELGITQRALAEKVDQATRDCLFCRLSSAPGAEGPNLVHVEEGLGIIMDRFPLRPGHLLIYPTEHAADPFDMPPDAYLRLMRLSYRLAPILQQVFGVDKIGLFTAGKHLSDHAHVHLLPLDTGLKTIFAELHDQPPTEGAADVLSNHASRIGRLLRETDTGS